MEVHPSHLLGGLLIILIKTPEIWNSELYINPGYSKVIYSKKGLFKSKRKRKQKRKQESSPALPCPWKGWTQISEIKRQTFLIYPLGPNFLFLITLITCRLKNSYRNCSWLFMSNICRAEAESVLLLVSFVKKDFYFMYLSVCLHSVCVVPKNI